jgi:LPXTG-site transpeptidase (sortase) family protein
VFPEALSATLRQRRRLLAVALMLVALGLFAAAAASAPRSKSFGSQYERALPVPVEGGRVALASTVTPEGSRRKRPRKSVQKAIPVRIKIPAIGVSAPVIRLGLNRDHTLQVPKSFALTGWFQPGPEPGERGAAIIVGHVDSKAGPGIFYHLRALRRGDLIRVILKNNERVAFVVTGMRAVPKTRFPARLVYAKSTEPTLRLITCDGAFNSSTGHYVDNYIVFAKLRERS